MRAKLLAVVLLAIAAAATVSAAEPSLPPGHDRYIVVLERKAKDGGKSVGDEAKKAGGTVEADLGGRLVITAPPAAIETLLRHEAVKYVQKAVVGPVADAGRLSDARAMSAMDAPVQTHSGHTWTSGDYSYDGAGNIASIGTAAVPGTQGYRTYGYDSVTRLTKAEIAGVTPGATYEYSYDAYGNRTGYAMNQQWSSVAVSSATNRLTDATYDTSGNQLSRGATSATYDGFGMVTSYRHDWTNAETYVYTASDERIGVLRGTDWTWSLRGDDGLVLRQYRSSSTSPTAPWLWIEDFVYRDGLLLGSERVPEEGGRRHYHLDHLGSPRLVTGLNGSVISEHDFLPFGEERTTISQHLARGFDREEPLRFTGHERGFDNLQPNDSSAYVDYMHARYYATKAGRFLSIDPLIGNLLTPQSWNRYAYVLNDPVNLIDPTGLLPIGSYGSGMLRGEGATGGIICDIHGCRIAITVTAEDPLSELLRWLEERWYAVQDIRNPVTGMTVGQHATANVNFAVGFGDASSLGLTALLRDEEDAQNVDSESLAYAAGIVSGTANSYAYNRIGFTKGYEFTRNPKLFRLAPWGNRTGHPTGRYPHYHLKRPGPGGSIKRHRPWDTRATDKSSWSRFW